MSFGWPARCLVLGACAALLASFGAAAGEESGWRQPIERFAAERTLAEDCAVLLTSLAERNPMARVQGQRLYQRARADMDGLIALLEADLAGERSPAAIAELRHHLEAVPQQRQALCRHVDRTVGAALRDAPERVAEVQVLAEGSSDTLGSLIDAAVRIWQAYRGADAAERARIRSALAGTRWRDYVELSADPAMSESSPQAWAPNRPRGR